MQITREQTNAAAEIADLITEHYSTNGQLNHANAISTAARLAGSCMFRSFHFQLTDVQPGSAVLSEQANEKGPALINILYGALSSFGAKVDSLKMDNAIVPDPAIPFVEALTPIQPAAFAIMKRHQLDFEQMAVSVTLATAFLIKEAEKDFPLNSGFNTAMYGFVEGTKTWPPE